MSLMFQAMSSTLTTEGDLPLFLNVISGALLLHAEDTTVMRRCMATLINASQHFKQVFSTTGYVTFAFLIHVHCIFVKHMFMFNPW